MTFQMRLGKADAVKNLTVALQLISQQVMNAPENFPLSIKSEN